MKQYLTHVDCIDYKQYYWYFYVDLCLWLMVNFYASTRIFFKLKFFACLYNNLHAILKQSIIDNVFDKKFCQSIILQISIKNLFFYYISSSELKKKSRVTTLII